MTEEEVFLAVLDLPNEAARAAYLDETCGSNAALRRQVEGLLAAHFRSGEFLDVPAPEQVDIGTNADFPVTIQSGDMSDDKTLDDDDDGLPFLAPATRPDSLGRIGHYEVLQVLGKGGFGIVFRAFDDTLQRVVAIKVMAPQLAATSPARKRFLREARSSAQVRHENVVQVYAVEELPLPYLAMEFIPGETLQQRLDRTGPLDVQETLRIGRQIAEGLAAAHATDLIHRDIKPGNVLLEGGQHKVKITDFGLARAADDASMTQSGMIAGTPMYMAPEQALGQTLDQRADLFSLGSVLYQTLAGRPPFRANTTVAVLKRVAEDTPRPIREVIPETPQWLCDIIAKLHAKNPDERYQSAREVADVLADCEAQLKANSRLQDFSRIPRTARVTSGNWKWIAAAAVLLPIIALAVTEFTGVTKLLQSQATSEPIKPEIVPTPVAVEQAPLPEEPALEFDGDADYVATPLVYDGSTPLTVEAIVQISQWPLQKKQSHGEIVGCTQLGGFGLGTAKTGFYLSARVGEGYVNVYSPQDDRYLNRPVKLAGVIDNKALRLFVDGKQVGQTGFENAFKPSKERISLGTSPGDGTPHDGNGYEWAGKMYELRISSIARYKSEYDASAPLIADEHTLSLYRFDEGSGDILKDSSGNGHDGKIVGARWNESPASTAKLESLPPTYKNTLGMEFVIVPKGKSWLGGGKDKPGDKEVEIPADFYLGKYEVTQEEWEKVMGENPSHFSRTGKGMDAVKDIPDADLKRFPVENVSWNQCQTFVAKLNQLEKETGWVYQLPTESQREYACRGGPMVDKSNSAFDFYFAEPTNTFSPDKVNSNYGLSRTREVGAYEANRLGLCDMHGNVWEWCYSRDKQPSHAGLQGGGWSTEKVTELFTRYRANGTPDYRSSNLGLRLARVPSGAPSPAVTTPTLAANALKDAVLLMNFEKDNFYEKDGKTYARDLSGNGNDGLCENVEFTPDGQAGSGLLCKEGVEGRLQLAKSLILSQPNYTITTWCRWDKSTGRTGTNLYRTCLPDRLGQGVFHVGIPPERSVTVNAWNRNLPKNWNNVSTDAGAVPAGWFFVAVSLTDGETDQGKLRIVIDDKTHLLTSQMVATVDSPVDLIGRNMAGAVIDELAVFQRALSDEEIAAVRALGLKGTSLDPGKPTPISVAAKQVEEVRKELQRLNPGFDGQVAHRIEDDVVVELSFVTDQVTDISPVRALTGLKTLSCSASDVRLGQLSAAALLPLKGLPLTNLNCRDSPALSDLSALVGMKLTTLDCRATSVGDADLKHLAGMKDLQILSLWGTKVTDAGLKEVAGLKNLQHLSLQTTKVTDAGLKEIVGLEKLVSLDLYVVTGVTDAGLEHLARLKALRSLDLRGPEVTNGGVDKLAAALPALQITTWDRVIEPKVVPFTDADAERIAALPAIEQIEEVRKELMRLNTGFDGKLTPTIENEVVTELSVNTDQVVNIAPVRALTKLVYLDCRGTYPNKGKLSDLSPIKDMKLSHIDCSSTQIADLSPLADMPLTNLQFNHNPVDDLTPLQKMPLETLGCAETKVSDFSPLRGLKLKVLGAQLLAVTDLSPLEGMPLTGIDLYHTVGVTSLAPLKGMPLEGLNLQDVPVSDLSPLASMTSLRTLVLHATKISDLSPLAELKLTDLFLNNKQITDLSPLKGLPLSRLTIDGTGVSDLRPLQGMSLAEIRLTPKNITQGLDILREMKSLKIIGIDGGKAWEPAEFWERYDKGEFKE